MTEGQREMISRLFLVLKLTTAMHRMIPYEVNGRQRDSHRSHQDNFPFKKTRGLL